MTDDLLDPPRSAGIHTRRLIGARGHLVHQLSATDSNGRRAYYFLLVEPAMEPVFLERIRNPQGDVLNLEDYGIILASCFGERPTEETRRRLREDYALAL